MIIDVIVNRGILNIIGPTDLKTGTTPVLPAGDHKILFADYGYEAYDNADYYLIFQVFNASGVKSGFTRGAKETDGFNVTLSYDSYVEFNAN